MKRNPQKLLAPKPRGFAVLSAARRKAIARLGGKAHSREHFARIGALGGAAKGKALKDKA